MEMVKRLIWKEACRNWPWLAIGLLLPQGCFALAVSKINNPDFPFEMLPPLAFFIIAMALIVRGAVLADEQRHISYSRTHFPVSPVVSQASVFLFHLLGVLLVAAGFGWWYSLHGNAILPAILPVLFTALFGVTYLASLVFSPWVGIIAGIGWFLGDMSSIYPFMSPGESAQIPFDSTYLVRSLTAVGIGSLVVPAPVRRMPSIRRIAVILVLAWVGLASPTLRENFDVNRLPALGFAPRSGYPHLPMVLTGEDGSLVVELFAYDPARDIYNLRFGDYRRGRVLHREFNGPAVSMGLDQQAAILATQAPGARDIVIKRWTLDDDTLATVATIPVQQGGLKTMLWGSLQSPGWQAVSPDGRHALLQLPSRLGTAWARDLWLIDLRTGATRIALPGRSSWILEVSWMGDTALLPMQGSMWQLDLTSGKISPLRERALMEARQ